MEALNQLPWLPEVDPQLLSCAPQCIDQPLAEQYRSWEKLCDLQVEQNPDRPAFCVRSKLHLAAKWHGAMPSPLP